MINVTGRTARRQYWREYIQRLSRFERNMYRKIFISLKRQYRAAARDIEEGNAIDWTIDSYDPEMYKIYVDEFQRFGVIYNELVQRQLSVKLIDSVFWTFFFGWLRRYAAEKVVQISLTTKNILKNILKHGQETGLSNVETAKFIRGNVVELTGYRAARIARTEVHTGVNTAIHESVRVTNQVEEKEWLAAMDTRTREEHMWADGERVLINEPYVMTGESLMYPGDPAGSGWNIINCRCPELFHTKEVA